MPTDFFYALTLPFNFLWLKGFPFFLPYLPTSGTDSWLHRLPSPFFREPSQSPKKQLLTKKGNIQTEYFISENGRYIQAPANKESYLPKGRSVSSEIPSRSAGISLISGANHSDSYEKTILQRIACMIRQTFSTVYSEYNQRISSHTACLPPSPDGFFLLTSSACRTEYPIHGLPLHPLLRKPRCIKTKKTPNKKMSGVFYQVFTDLQFKLLQQLLRKEFLQKLPCEV